jgi:formate--tetrahydrofolate ligase
MAALAARVVAAADRADTSKIRPLYAADLSFEQKITEVATKVYGAKGVAFKPGARNRLQQYAALGYGHLPVCIAKTQYSFTDDAKGRGAPCDWTLTISDASLSAGAGFVVVTAGSMMLMPGLGKVPQAQKLDVNDSGDVVGMDY